MINRKYTKLINETITLLEQQSYYEDFLDIFTLFFIKKLPLKAINLFYYSYDDNELINYPKGNIKAIKNESNLIKHLQSTKQIVNFKNEKMDVVNILKKDNAILFDEFKIDIIIPLFSKNIAGLVIIEATKSTYKELKQLNSFFSLFSKIIISNIIIERDNIRKRKNYLKQFRHDRLAITGELAATASHEIKNIHGIILANLAYFNEKKKVSVTELRESIKDINTSIEQAEYIVKSMVSVSQFNEIIPEAIDVSVFVEDTLNLLAFRISKNIKIEKNFKNDLIIHSSYQLLSQAFINIFINSIDAIESKKGTITVITDMISPKEYQTDKVCVISIKDTGPGFSKEILDNLYSKYKTTKKQGTGLGLYNTLNIIKRIGGELEIKSSKTGSEVIMKLPERMK